MRMLCLCQVSNDASTGPSRLHLFTHSGFRSERYHVGLMVGTRRCTPKTTAPAVSRPTSALHTKNQNLEACPIACRSHTRLTCQAINFHCQASALTGAKRQASRDWLFQSTTLGIAPSCHLSRSTVAQGATD